MGIRSRRLRLPAAALVLLALLLALGTAWPAAADQNAPALDGLFRDLRAAETPQQARRIEAQIWSHWFDSGSPEIDELFETGEALMGVQRHDLAHRVFDKIVAQRPDLSEGWNRRAITRYLMGDYEGSIADIDETLKREPRHFGALSGLGLCHLALGDEAAALAAMERALIHHPHMPGVKMRLQRLRARLGHLAI